MSLNTREVELNSYSANTLTDLMVLKLKHFVVKEEML